VTKTPIKSQAPQGLGEAFARATAFIPYIVGGDPNLDATEELLYALDEAGADLIEIGIPFSDPIAEGPVIEAAYLRALEAGCTTDKLLDMVGRVHKHISAPLLFMSYYNPIFAYGASRFAKRCAANGIKGLIVPDLPFEERDELLAPCRAEGIELISLIAPTSNERIARIANCSSGFLYCVSSLGVTGMRQDLDDSAKRMIAQVRATSSIPCAVGFGITTPEQARTVAGFADGVIIGSALVNMNEECGSLGTQAIARYARSIKQAISN